MRRVKKKGVKDVTGNRTRIFLAALVFTLLLACMLTACGNAGQTAAPSTEAAPAPAEEAPAASLGSLVITPETDTVDLEEAGATIEDLMRASDSLGGVKKIALGLTDATAEQLEAVCKAFPDAKVTWKANVLGTAVESTAEERAAFGQYLDQQLGKIRLENADENFLRERLVEMYANPYRNHIAAL